MVLHLVCERVGSRHHSPAPRQNNVAGRVFSVGGVGSCFWLFEVVFEGGDFVYRELRFAWILISCVLGFDGGSGYGALVAGMIMIEI